MKKIAVLYWSSMGNTEKMAQAIAEGAKAAGAEVKLDEMANSTPAALAAYDAVALGCSATGDEVLDDGIVEPFVEALAKVDLSKKTVLLFGSHDWGDGTWMRNWEECMSGYGVGLLLDSVTAQNEPDEAALAECQSAGEQLTH